MLNVAATFTSYGLFLAASFSTQIPYPPRAQLFTSGKGCFGALSPSHHATLSQKALMQMNLQLHHVVKDNHWSDCTQDH